MATTLLVVAGAAATVVAAAATGDAKGAAHAIAPGLKVALAHVPSWTHAYQVLSERLAALEKGLANVEGAAKRAIAYAYGHGR